MQRRSAPSRCTNLGGAAQPPRPLCTWPHWPAPGEGLQAAMLYCWPALLLLLLLLLLPPRPPVAAGCAPPCTRLPSPGALRAPHLQQPPVVAVVLHRPHQRQGLVEHAGPAVEQRQGHNVKEAQLRAA